jgi:hypothetical protein
VVAEVTVAKRLVTAAQWLFGAAIMLPVLAAIM